MDGCQPSVPRRAVACLVVSFVFQVNAIAAGTGVVIDARNAPPGIDFHADVRQALDYISGDATLDALLKQGSRIEIRYTGAHTRIEFRTQDKSAVIHFNPRLGTRLRNGSVQSPALVLAHELGHVCRALQGKAHWHNGRFSVAEEQAVVNDVEARVARLAGEPVRHRYIGTPVAVNSVTLGRRKKAATGR